MYLSVCPESLDQVAVSLAARVPELPSPAQVLGDLEAIGACLPGFVNHTPAPSSVAGGGRPSGEPWGRSLRDLGAAWVAHSGTLGRSAQSYREVDARPLQ